MVGTKAIVCPAALAARQRACISLISVIVCITVDYWFVAQVSSNPFPLSTYRFSERMLRPGEAAILDLADIVVDPLTDRAGDIGVALDELR